MADEDDAPEGVGESESAPADQAQDTEQQEAPRLTEVETIAAEMGWRPKDQWNGEVSEWKPATAFLKDTRRINDDLRKSVKSMGKQLENIGRTSAEMTQRAVAAERQRLEAMFEQAVEDGDKEGAKALRREIGRIEASPAPAGPSPEVQEWIAGQSSWFGKDTEATNYAVMRCEHYAQQGLSEARQLKALEKDMRELFPDLLPAPAQPSPPAKPQASVGTPERTARPAIREKGYATLSPAERKACDAWVASNKDLGAWVTKEAWAEQHYASQEAKNG